MSDERPPSRPPEDKETASAEQARPNSSVPPSSGMASAPDTVRLPPIPGLVPPRFPGRVALDRSTLGSSASPIESSHGLRRPHLPQRKPMPSPLFDSASSAVGEDDSPERKIFTGPPVRPTPKPRRLVPPPKPVPPSTPATANSAGTGTAPRRRMTPAPHSPATITAMRIISIGVEDRPPPSEYSAESLEHEGASGTEEWPPANDGVPLPSFEIAESTAPIPRRPSADLYAQSGPSEIELPLPPLPSFELTETEPSTPDAQDALTVPLAAFTSPEAPPAVREPESEPLPAFDLPEAEPAAPTAAVAALTDFEIVKPVDAPPDLEFVPVAPPAAAESFEEEQPPPLPGLALSGADAAIEEEQPPPLPGLALSGADAAIEEEQPPPLPARPELVELGEDDVSPDSVKPPPPKPPARVSTNIKVPKPKSDPPSPPSRASAPAMTAADALLAVPDPNEAAGASTKRIPPPPPRRSLPVPNEGQVESATPAQTAAASSSGAAVPSETPAEKSKADDKAVRARRPWWEELFNEDYSRALSRLSDEQIKREATFIEDSLGVAEGGVLLDLGCGPGYHAVELAERGYAVVGYDLSLHQLALAADVAQERQQKLNLMQGDMREMAFDSVFDGIYCWNTTFGYFEEDKNLLVAERIFKALKPGGTFLVDVINRDFVAMQQPSSVWFEGDSAVCMDDMTVDFITSRLRVKRSLMLDDGRTKECPYSIRLYSLHELGTLLHHVGFRVAEASGQPSTPGVFMGQNAPRIIILAQRP